jgi:hypothetical protein
VARDANGRTLPSWLGLERGRLLLRVDARGARYPLRIDPFIQQGGKLTGGGEEAGFFGGLFGFTVALSADGNTALIGGPFDNSGVGAAWVFTRSGSTWTQQGEKLTAKSEEETGTGLFGQSVALSADGNTALIGALFDSEGKGAAWVFTRSGSTWTQQGAKLAANSAEAEGGGLFGGSVALSGDGNTALIGAGSDKEGAGAAWTFTRSGTTWAQEGKKLTPASGEVGPGEFGESVALSTDGETALIGGGVDNGSVGAAWAFTRSGPGWTQQGEKLTANSTEKAAFGQSVALSGDGQTALIGGPADNNGAGAAWAFTQSESGWTQQGEKLTPKSSEEVGAGELGQSVALSTAAETALIGAGSDNEGAGAAWAFTRSGATWTQLGEKITPTSGEEIGKGGFGGAVALSSDGQTGLIGAFFDAGGAGAAWAFVIPPPTATIALADPTINVSRHGKAAIMLTCTGTAPSCGVELTLTAQDTVPTDGWTHEQHWWRHQHGGTVVIGNASASIPSGETTTVRLHLNRRGRRLLDASQGSLAATLTILKFDPKPEEEQTDPVELVQQQPERWWWSGD